MPPKKRKALVQPPIRLSSPELWKLEFEQLETDDNEIDLTSLPLIFQLSVNRLSTYQVGVEFGVQITELQSLRVVVAYRIVCEIELDGATDEQLDQQLRSIAGHFLPTTLYPFIRETITTNAAKAGLPPLVLPVVNFRKMINIDELQIPPVLEQE